MPVLSSYMRVHVVCPFYRGDENKRRIICEGLVDRSTISLSFGSMRDFDKQTEVFCCKHYKNCEIYRMLMENKYQGL